MHGQEGAEYKDVSAKVDAAVATLVELTGTSADGHADHDHGHDHAEDDHSDHDHAEEKK